MALRFPRRKLLKAAAAIGILGGAGSLVAFFRTRGYELPSEVNLAALAPWEWIVVRELARRVCAADRAGVVSADETDVAGFVDAYAAQMPRKMRRDVGRFFAFTEHVAPLGAGFATRFSRLGAVDQDAVLSSLESHANDLVRGGFEGVKALLFMGYYRDPRTWGVIGYDGPLVARPEGGWGPKDLGRTEEKR